jgi:hypothetical protein
MRVGRVAALLAAFVVVAAAAIQLVPAGVLADLDGP